MSWSLKLECGGHNEPVLRELICGFCIEKLSPRDIPVDLAHDVNIFEAGIIDWIDALELLIGFEEDRGVMVPEQLQDVSDIGSLDGMYGFVVEKVDPETLEEKLGMKILIG